MLVRRSSGVFAAGLLVTWVVSGSAVADAGAGTTVAVPGPDVTNRVPGAFGIATTGCDHAEAPSSGSPNTLVDVSTGSPLGHAYWALDHEGTPTVELYASGPSRHYDELSDFTSASLDVLDQNPADGAAEGTRGFAYADASGHGRARRLPGLRRPYGRGQLRA